MPLSIATSCDACLADPRQVTVMDVTIFGRRQRLCQVCRDRYQDMINNDQWPCAGCLRAIPNTNLRCPDCYARDITQGRADGFRPCLECDEPTWTSDQVCIRCYLQGCRAPVNVPAPDQRQGVRSIADVMERYMPTQRATTRQRGHRVRRPRVRVVEKCEVCGKDNRSCLFCYNKEITNGDI